MYSAGPVATPIALGYDAANNPFTPRPTARALLGSVAVSQLLQHRQVDEAECGLYEGNPITCEAGYVCASNAAHSAAGCCLSTALEDCIIPTTCVNSASMGYCDVDCMNDDLVRKCTNAANPYCFAEIWDYYPQVTEWGCATVNTYITLEPNPQFTATDTTFAAASASSVAPSSSSTPQGDGSSDTNDCGNQIDGNEVTDGGSIAVDNSGGNSCGSSGSSNGGSGGSASSAGSQGSTSSPVVPEPTSGGGGGSSESSISADPRGCNNAALLLATLLIASLAVA